MMPFYEDIIHLHPKKYKHAATITVADEQRTALIHNVIVKKYPKYHTHFTSQLHFVN